MAVRSYHCPTRENGQRRLHAIPVEIYMLILDEVLGDNDMPLNERKSILSSMNLVCRLFSTLVVPKLFSDVSFKGVPQKEAEKRKRGVRHTWLKRLAQGEEAACSLGAFVKRVEYSDWVQSQGGSQSTSVYPDLSRHISVLSRFPNLQNLHLTRSSISHDFLKVVLALKGLKSLCITHCSLETPDDRIQTSGVSLPSLMELAVVGVEDIDPYVQVLALLARAPTLRSLKTSEWVIARSLMENAKNAPLEKLDVPFVPSDAGILCAYLDRTPTIVELSLVIDTTPSITDGATLPRPLSLRSVSLPRLKDLRCPLHLIGTLFKNHSISRLSLVSPLDWFAPGFSADERMLAPLKQCHLRELEVPAYLLYNYPVDKYAPHLVKLSVCFSMHTISVPLERVVKEFCARSHKSSLQILEFHFVNAFWKLNLPLQHRMVTEHLSKAYPTVKRLSLIDEFEWYRVTDVSEWRLAIREREAVKTLLQVDDPGIWKFMEVADFNGALAALFGDGEMTPALGRRLSGGVSKLAPAS